jgi:hypothetical protein
MGTLIAFVSGRTGWAGNACVNECFEAVPLSAEQSAAWDIAVLGPVGVVGHARSKGQRSVGR